jgi:hypothetical protein
MKNGIKLISLLIIAVVILAGTIACTSSTSSTSTESALRDYADPATETTLQGFSENNLAKYAQYGNAEFKAAITQEILAKSSAQIGSQLGTYQSKEYLSTEEQQGYVIVHYKTRFTKGEVGVRMVFDKDHMVAGQWFE